MIDSQESSSGRANSTAPAVLLAAVVIEFILGLWVSCQSRYMVRVAVEICIPVDSWMYENILSVNSAMHCAWVCNPSWYNTWIFPFLAVPEKFVCFKNLRVVLLMLIALLGMPDFVLVNHLLPLHPRGRQNNSISRYLQWFRNLTRLPHKRCCWYPRTKLTVMALFNFGSSLIISSNLFTGCYSHHRYSFLSARG